MGQYRVGSWPFGLDYSSFTFADIKEYLKILENVFREDFKLKYFEPSGKDPISVNSFEELQKQILQEFLQLKNFKGVIQTGESCIFYIGGETQIYVNGIKTWEKNILNFYVRAEYGLSPNPEYQNYKPKFTIFVRILNPKITSTLDDAIKNCERFNKLLQKFKEQTRFSKKVYGEGEHIFNHGQEYVLVDDNGFKLNVIKEIDFDKMKEIAEVLEPYPYLNFRPKLGEDGLVEEFKIVVGRKGNCDGTLKLVSKNSVILTGKIVHLNDIEFKSFFGISLTKELPLILHYKCKNPINEDSQVKWTNQTAKEFLKKRFNEKQEIKWLEIRLNEKELTCKATCYNYGEWDASELLTNIEIIESKNVLGLPDVVRKI